jgi:hypothetical protein
MSLGNMDARLHQLQGLVGLNAAGMGGFPTAAARQNQGIAMFPDLVRDVASRADLGSSLNMVVYQPALNIAGVQPVLTGAAILIGVLIDNAEAANATYVQVFNTASGGVTIGTTVELLDLFCAAGQMKAYLLVDPLSFGTAISWDATTAPHGAARNTVSTVRVSLVYAA